MNSEIVPTEPSIAPVTERSNQDGQDGEYNPIKDLMTSYYTRRRERSEAQSSTNGDVPSREPVFITLYGRTYKFQYPGSFTHSTQDGTVSSVDTVATSADVPEPREV